MFFFLQDLALNDGIYRIRVATKNNAEEEEYVSTFTKAVSTISLLVVLRWFCCDLS